MLRSHSKYPSIQVSIQWEREKLTLICYHWVKRPLCQMLVRLRTTLQCILSTWPPILLPVDELPFGCTRCFLGGCYSHSGGTQPLCTQGLLTQVRWLTCVARGDSQPQWVTNAYNTRVMYIYLTVTQGNALTRAFPSPNIPSPSYIDYLFKSPTITWRLAGSWISNDIRLMKNYFRGDRLNILSWWWNRRQAKYTELMME